MWRTAKAEDWHNVWLWAGRLDTMKPRHAVHPYTPVTASLTHASSTELGLRPGVEVLGAVSKLIILHPHQMLCRAATSPRASRGSMAHEEVVPSVASSMHGSRPARHMNQPPVCSLTWLLGLPGHQNMPQWERLCGRSGECLCQVHWCAPDDR